MSSYYVYGKNPAYGRHWFSRPMRIVEPMQWYTPLKEHYQPHQFGRIDSFTKYQWVRKAKFVLKNFFLCGNFRPLPSKKFQIWDHLFPLLFPKDSEYLKSLDIGLREVGAKRPLNGVNKVWRTDKHTKQKQIGNGKILR